MPKNLLLADDSITIQKVVAITFANEDYAVTTVDNGDDALAKARASRPDVVLLDVVMPKKNGYEACEALKADPSFAGVPVILLAGTFEAFDENRARAVRADAWIQKPFESQALINKVKELVEGAAPVAAPGAINFGRPAAPVAAPPAPPPPAAAPAPAPRPAAPPAAAMPPGARPPPGAMPPPARPAPAAMPPPAAAPRPAPVAAPPPPAVIAPPPPPPPVVIAPPPPPPPAAPAAAEDDWSDVDLAPQAAAQRGTPEPVLDFEPEPLAAEPPRAAPAPIEISEEITPELELAPLHEFVPPQAATGHQPAVAAPAGAAAPAADGGEAVLREALSRASREVIERVVWEVVPQLAETIIRENLDRLVKSRQG